MKKLMSLIAILAAMGLEFLPMQKVKADPPTALDSVLPAGRFYRSESHGYLFFEFNPKRKNRRNING
jgi:hypothetical protein